MLTGRFLFNLHTVLKRAAIKKSKNDLIHAEEGEDHFTDICSVGEYWLRIPRGLALHLNAFASRFLRAPPLLQELLVREGELSQLPQQRSTYQSKRLHGFPLSASPALPGSAVACCTPRQPCRRAWTTPAVVAMLSSCSEHAHLC